MHLRFSNLIGGLCIYQTCMPDHITRRYLVREELQLTVIIQDGEGNGVTGITNQFIDIKKTNRWILHCCHDNDGFIRLHISITKDIEGSSHDLWAFSSSGECHRQG